MKTAAQYHHELDELKVIQKTDQDTLGKKEFLGKLTHLENQVALDLHSLSSQFHARAVSQLNNTRLKAGKGKATAEKKLLDDQNSRLTPYQEILDQIKEMIKTLI